MNWRRQIQRYPYYYVLEKQKREMEALENKRKEEEKRAWKAREKFKDIISAERKYKKDVEAEIYEVSIWDVLKIQGVKPLFKDLWELSKACADQRGCYRMLVHFRLAHREGDLQLVREAERLGADVELVTTLLYNGKREEAAKLLRP
jgi:hypothetical protein